VLAELGAVGFVLYIAFLAGAARLLWEAFRRERLLGLGLAACFLVLLLHSLFYSGFFEDPVMWGVLGVAAMLVAPSPAVTREELRPGEPAPEIVEQN
jgi:hypothetical protein